MRLLKERTEPATHEHITQKCLRQLWEHGDMRQRADPLLVALCQGYHIFPGYHPIYHYILKAVEKLHADLTVDDSRCGYTGFGRVVARGGASGIFSAKRSAAKGRSELLHRHGKEGITGWWRAAFSDTPGKTWEKRKSPFSDTPALFNLKVPHPILSHSTHDLPLVTLYCLPIY